MDILFKRLLDPFRFETWSELAAIILMLAIFLGAGVPLAILMDQPVAPTGPAPTQPCTPAPPSAATQPQPGAKLPKVSDASGESGTLNVFVGRNDEHAQRQSSSLTIQSGTLTAQECLAAGVSDLLRSDGASIPADQVTAWAVADNTGTHVTVFIDVSPRYKTVSGSGGYTGTVFLDDARATGASVPVDIHLEYPYLWAATLACLAAAFAGFFWAWLINKDSASPAKGDKFWLYLLLQIAVLIAVAIPVLNVQVLSNPDWSGNFIQYIALATLAGGAALAATPTLRTLVDKVSLGPAQDPPAQDPPAQDPPAQGPEAGTTQGTSESQGVAK
jgi:hypothetical protein